MAKESPLDELPAPLLESPLNAGTELPSHCPSELPSPEPRASGNWAEPRGATRGSPRREEPMELRAEPSEMATEPSVAVRADSLSALPSVEEFSADCAEATAGSIHDATRSDGRGEAQRTQAGGGRRNGHGFTLAAWITS